MTPADRLRKLALALSMPLLLPLRSDAQTTLPATPVTPLTSVYNDWLSDPVVSPNGRFYLATRYGGEAVAYDTSRKRWTPVKGEIGEQARWSPDGRFVASIRLDPLKATRFLWLTPIDTSTGLPTGTSRRISARQARAPGWSPDSRRIAFSSTEGGSFRIVVTPFNGGDDEVVYTYAGGGGQTAWTPDGKSIVAILGPQGNQMVRVDLASKRARVMSTPLGGAPLGILPDGSAIARWTFQTKQLVLARTTDGASAGDYTLSGFFYPHALMPSGNAVLATQPFVPQHLELVDTKTGAIRELTAVDTSLIGAVRYSPDGRSIAYLQGAHVRLQSLAGGTRRTVSLPVGNAFRDLKWSTDGKQIVACDAKAIALIDVATAKSRLIADLADSVVPRVTECRWAKRGTVIHWSRSKPGAIREHEVRELALSGASRVIARFRAQGLASLLDDTLVLHHSSEGMMATHLVNGSTKLLVKGIPWSYEAQWSADGRRLLLVMTDGAIGERFSRGVPYLFDPKAGTGTRVPYSLPGELSYVRFHPDGRHLVVYFCATCVEAKYVEKWDIALVPLNGEPARVLTASQKDYRDHGSFDISPDGAHIAFLGEKAYTSRLVSITLPRR